MAGKEDPRLPSFPAPIDKESELPQDSVERCALLMEQGQHLNAYKAWFAIGEDVRETAFRSAIHAVKPNQSLREARRDQNLSLSDRFVLTHFSVLSSNVASRIVDPAEGEIFTRLDLVSLRNSYPPFATLSGLVEEEKREDIYFENNAEDFQSAADLFKRSFTADEMGRLLKGVLPYLPVDTQLFGRQSFIHLVRHADLVLDPVLAPYVKDKLLGIGLGEYLMQCLTQRYFPSVEFLELNIHEARDGSSYYSDREISDGTYLPMGALTFELLRRVNQFIEKPQSQTEERLWDITLEEMDTAKAMVITYLFSNDIMRHVIAYVGSDVLYKAGSLISIISPNAVGIDTSKIAISETGEAAQKVKAQQFTEVLKAIVAYLEKKGDAATLQRLQEREIDGFRFADFLMI